jgi:FkbM family methyltransferase
MDSSYRRDMPEDVTLRFKDFLRSIGSSRPYFVQTEMQFQQLQYASLSYSLAGEDLVIRDLFKRHFLNRQTGFYVDIGCYHPALISNTFMFYCTGWRGVCVDANGQLAAKWAQLRPHDTYLHAAVGEADGEVNLYRHRTNLGMSRISDACPGDDWHPVAEKVPMTQLSTLFEGHVGERSIQFMSIDVEGSEMSVLRSNDWTRWSPEVILLECHEFDFAAPAAAPTISFLFAQGYALRLRVGMNVVLVKADR